LLTLGYELFQASVGGHDAISSPFAGDGAKGRQAVWPSSGPCGHKDNEKLIKMPLFSEKRSTFARDKNITSNKPEYD